MSDRIKFSDADSQWVRRARRRPGSYYKRKTCQRCRVRLGPDDEYGWCGNCRAWFDAAIASAKTEGDLIRLILE